MTIYELFLMTGNGVDSLFVKTHA